MSTNPFFRMVAGTDIFGSLRTTLRRVRKPMLYPLSYEGHEGLSPPGL
jgi:hypothetical protein